MKIKFIIPLIIFGVGIIYGDYVWLKSKKTENSPYIELIGKDCGTVTNNFTGFSNKNGRLTVNYLLKVKFQNGEEKIIDVSPQVYYEKNNVGSNICIDKTKNFDFWIVISIMLTWVFLMGSGIVLILYYFEVLK